MKDFLSEIIGRVKTELEIQAEAVTAGTNVNSYEDYKHYVGKIEGLQTALDIIDEILAENDDES
jgi:hypothetical protein